jgi:hypothetical protein
MPYPAKRRLHGDNGGGPMLYEDLRVLENVNSLTRLFLVGCGYRNEGKWVYRFPHDLHFPALRYLYTRNSDLPSIEAPALDMVFLDRDTRVAHVQLWNLLIKAPHIKQFSSSGMASVQQEFWDDVASRKFVLPRLDRLVSRFSSQGDFVDMIQFKLLGCCQPSSLRVLGLSFTLAFGLDATMRDFPTFYCLQDICIAFDTNYKPTKAGWVHRAMTELATLIAKAPNLEEFTFNSSFFRPYFEPDLLIQVFLSLPQKFWPHLSRLSFKGPQFTWLSLVREVFRVRSATDSEKGETFKIGIQFYATGHVRTSVTLGPYQTPEDTERELDRLVSENPSEAAEKHESIKPVFEMESPEQRLEFLCNILGHRIPPEPVFRTHLLQ